MKLQNYKTYISRSAFLIPVISLFACSSSISPEVERAQSSLGLLKAQPEIVRYAPRELNDAENSVVAAKQHWDKHRDEEEVRHLTYVADRRMELAIIKASSGVSEVEAERLYQLQDKIILNDRVRDARNEASFYKEQTALKDDEISKLTSTLQDLQAKQTARGLEFTMNDFLFDFNKSTLKSGGERRLSPIAEFLTLHQEQQVKIEGHTDNVGSEQYNINLSEARSEAVKSALVNMGVSSARIATKGLGEEYPVSSNDTEAGRLENRRVEIVITKATI